MYCPKVPKNSNPLHQHPDGTWWFFDEHWMEEHGPYETRPDAMNALKEYAKTL